MNTTPRLERTTNYDRFCPNKGQRSIDNGHVAKLVGDMKSKGFNPSKPLTVVKEGKKLSLIDGHHRLEAAKKAKVPVFFVTVSSNGIIPLNLLQRGWKGRDYLMHYVRKGDGEYIKLYNLIEKHGLGLSLTVGLAAGSGFHHVGKSFRAGTYEVKDDKLVEIVAKFGGVVGKVDKKLQNRSLLSAYSRCLQVKGFEPDRMEAAAMTVGKKLLTPTNTIEAYLDELEQVYNWHKSNTIPLAFLAKKKGRA
jgi:hypothetical protein